MRKLLVVPVMALVSVLGGSAMAADDLTAMTNADRAAGRLGTLATASDLQSFAQQRAEEMARAHRLWHTPNLGARVENWRTVGENVGRGPDLREIQAAFMDSPSHRQNILHPSFTQVGVGVAHDGGRLLYVAVVFREPKTTAAPAPAPPPPSPQPATATPPTTTPPTTTPPTTTPPTTTPPTTTPPTTAPPATTSTTAPPPPPDPAPAAVPQAAPATTAPEAEVAGESLQAQPLNEQRRLEAHGWGGALPASESRLIPSLVAGALILAGLGGIAAVRRRPVPLD